MKNLNFIDLLPETLKQHKEIINFSSIIDRCLSNIDNIIDKLTIYTSLQNDTLEEQYVDALAKTFHLLANESYRFASTVEQKRELVRNSLILHRTKGTKYAVERVCSILDLKNASIIEWFEDNGEPYTFKINLNSIEGLNQETVRLLYAMVDEFKNVRSHISVFEFNIKTYGLTYLAGNLIYNVEIESRQPFYTENNLNGNVFICGGIYCNTDMVV